MEPTKVRLSELYGQIYKDMKMGSDSIMNLMPKVQNEEFRAKLTEQFDGYERFAGEAKQKLLESNAEAKEENAFTKMTAKVGMTMNVMKDSTTSHMAEMVMQGSNMGITSMTRLLNEVKERRDGEYEEVEKLLEKIIAFEEKNMEAMKSYL